MIRSLGNGHFEVEIIHPGGERKWLIIEAIHHSFVSVRWGLSGVYDIFLKNNTMIARNLAARRKGKCYWKAVDIESVRTMVKEHFAPNTKIEVERLVKEHTNSMPYAKTRDHTYSTWCDVCDGCCTAIPKAKPLSSSK